jgi:hypothetical protein
MLWHTVPTGAKRRDVFIDRQVPGERASRFAMPVESCAQRMIRS